jgi:hypothetical protein
MPPVSPTTTAGDRIIGPVGLDPLLFSPRADDRLRTARAASKRARKVLEKRVTDWPPYSPGAINAWLLLVTTKPPVWRDPFVIWPDGPLTLGEPHEGFFYPDPMGFWAEVRRWSLELHRLANPTWGTPDALSVTTLLHLGEERERLGRALDLSAPRLVLFLDEPSWARSGLQVRTEPHYIHDPHRPKQVYEGFWGHGEDGTVVGKAPQHPSTHNLYRWDDMLGFLRSAPAPRGV